jgi:hypothetical protein
MQLYAGRPAHERRGFAAIDAANSGEPAPRHDSAGYHGAWRHQHRSNNDRGAGAKHIGMCLCYDDEPGDARHDDAGQCYRRRCHTRRIGSSISFGLLKEDASPMAFAPPSGGKYKTLFNGAAGSSSLCFWGAAPPRLPPKAVFSWP